MRFNSIQSVATAKQTLFKMTKPSRTMWLVAHNGEDVAHVIEMGPEQECLTGLGALEEYPNLVSAENQVKKFGWVKKDDEIRPEARQR